MGKLVRHRFFSALALMLLSSPSHAQETYATCRAKLINECGRHDCREMPTAKERGACQKDCVETRSCGCIHLPSPPSDKALSCGARIENTLKALRRPIATPATRQPQGQIKYRPEDLILISMARAVGDPAYTRKVMRTAGLSEQEGGLLELQMGAGEYADQWVNEVSRQLASEALGHGVQKVPYVRRLFDDVAGWLGYRGVASHTARYLSEKLTDKAFVEPVIDKVFAAPRDKRTSRLAVELMAAASDAARRAKEKE